MPKNSAKKPADYIVPLYMNGLEGRMLRAPSATKRQREILLVYGHHAMLERWWGLVENLQQYGTVTMPDLPGFGGMESLYKIGKRPTIDEFADYLVAFIKLRYKNKRVTIFAISYGFVVVTRMLQRYPELAKKVDLLVGVVGFMHKDDFSYSVKTRNLFRLAARLFATRPVAMFIRYCCTNKFVIKTLYIQVPNAKRRMIEVSSEDFDTSLNFEITLWQANDVRTHWLTTSEFFKLDNTHSHIPLDVIHVVAQQEHYFNNLAVEQHMRAVFKDYKQFTARSKAHTPSVLANKKAMGVLLPPGLRRILNKDPN